MAREKKSAKTRKLNHHRGGSALFGRFSMSCVSMQSLSSETRSWPFAPTSSEYLSLSLSSTAWQRNGSAGANKRDQISELLVQFVVTHFDGHGLGNDVKLMSAAPKAIEAGLCNVLEPRRNPWDTTNYFSLAVPRDPYDGIRPRLTKDLKSHCSHVANDLSSMPWWNATREPPCGRTVLN